jgi:hypothetical protein
MAASKGRLKHRNRRGERAAGSPLWRGWGAARPTVGLAALAAIALLAAALAGPAQGKRKQRPNVVASLDGGVSAPPPAAATVRPNLVACGTYRYPYGCSFTSLHAGGGVRSG